MCTTGNLHACLLAPEAFTSGLSKSTIVVYPCLMYLVARLMQQRTRLLSHPPAHSLSPGNGFSNLLPAFHFLVSPISSMHSRLRPATHILLPGSGFSGLAPALHLLSHHFSATGQLLPHPVQLITQSGHLSLVVLLHLAPLHLLTHPYLILCTCISRATRLHRPSACPAQLISVAIGNRYIKLDGAAP